MNSEMKNGTGDALRPAGHDARVDREVARREERMALRLAPLVLEPADRVEHVDALVDRVDRDGGAEPAGAEGVGAHRGVRASCPAR